MKPLAQSELEDILFYIRIVDGRPETACLLGERFREIADLQAAQELPGHKHPDAPEDWYYIGYKRWLLFYTPHPHGIEVMRVVDAVPDLPSVLRP